MVPTVQDIARLLNITIVAVMIGSIVTFLFWIIIQGLWKNMVRKKKKKKQK
jgi:hypothetical protein